MTRAALLVLTLACSAIAQSPIRATIDKLQAIPVEDMNTDVSPALATLHQQLKHQLRDFAIAVLNRGADLQSDLEKAGIRIGQDTKKSSFGQVYDVSVEWKPNGLATWAAVTTTLGVMCGEDSSLYLVERGEGGWQVRLAIESELSKDVGSGYGWPKYGFSKAGLDDQFLVVATNVTPWCTSVWQRLRIQAFTVGAGPNRPMRV